MMYNREDLQIFLTIDDPPSCTFMWSVLGPVMWCVL